MAGFDATTRHNGVPVFEPRVLTQFGDSIGDGPRIRTIYGTNADIDIASGYEDIWTQGGSWAAPTTDRVHAIVSTDAKDDLGGVGAEYIYIEGVSGGELTSETVELNGTSSVNTSNSYSSIHLMRVTQAGSENDNAGTITATAATDSTVTNAIAAGSNRSHAAVFQVPSTASSACIIPGGAGAWGVVGNASSEQEVRVLKSRDGLEWEILCQFPISDTTTKTLPEGMLFPLDPGDYVKLSANTDTDNQGVSGFVTVAFR